MNITTAVPVDGQAYLFLLLGGCAGVLVLTILVISCWCYHARCKKRHLRNLALGGDIPAVRLSEVTVIEEEDDVSSTQDSPEDSFEIKE